MEQVPQKRRTEYSTSRIEPPTRTIMDVDLLSSHSSSVREQHQRDVEDSRSFRKSAWEQHPRKATNFSTSRIEPPTRTIIDVEVSSSNRSSSREQHQRDVEHSRSFRIAAMDQYPQ